MTTPPTNLDLDEIEGRAAALYEYATLTDEPLQADANQLTGEDVPALLAEVRRLRAAVTDLAGRWDDLATQGDAAIGQFEGPAAAILDAEVTERGSTYRKAAVGIREVVATGRIPDDLLTTAERHAAESGSGR